MPNKQKDYSDEFQTFIDNGEHYQINSKIRGNIRDVIDYNDQAFHGKFESPMDGSFEKKYYNIGYVLFRTIFQVLVGTLGTKDIQMRSLNGKGIMTIAMFRLAIQSYLKRIKFGDFLNEVCMFIKDGTTYVKVVDGYPYVVNNHNIFLPSTDGNLQETGLAERQVWTWDQMLSHKEDFKDSWDKILEQKEWMDKKQVKDWVIYDYWNEFEFDGETAKGCIRYLNNTENEPEDRRRKPKPTEWIDNLEIDRFKATDKRRRQSKRMRKEVGEFEMLYPYAELTFVKVPGRSMGFSVFELVKDIQIDYNKKRNLHSKKDDLDLMGIHVHSKSNNSNSIAQQLMDNIHTGTVIEMDLEERLERLNIPTKTGELLSNVDDLFALARQVVGVTESASGVDMPATTTATTSVIQKQTQQTTYDYAIEQVSLFLTNLFNDFFLETVLDEIDLDDMNMISGDVEELKELDDYFARQFLNRRINATYKKTGIRGAYLGDIDDEGKMTEEEIGGAIDETRITPIEDGQAYEEQLAMVKEGLEKSGDERWVDIKKSFIKNLNYSFEFYVNNETFDKGIKVQNLQAMKQDTLLSKEKIDMTLMDLMGENPKAYKKSDEEKAAEIEQARNMAQAENVQTPAPIEQSAGQAFGQANQAV